MARSGRPASESYQSVCCSVGQTFGSAGEAGVLEDEDDRTPIFSLSKSSVDVVMAAGSPIKRDPAWSRLSLKRSSSTNTHSDQNQGTLQQLHHNKWRQNSHQFSPTTQNEDLMSPPPPLSERWISNTHRWSGCSSSTHSRSSTPDTVVWKDGSSRPCSLNQDASSCFAPDSPMSKLTSPPTTPSPFISPFHTPTLPPQDLLTPSSSPLSLSAQQLPEPRRWSTSSRKDGSSEKLLFQFPSPVSSRFSLAEGRSDPGHLANDTTKEQLSPGINQAPERKGASTASQTIRNSKPNSFAGKQETGTRSSGCHFELPWRVEQNCSLEQSWRSPLVSSMSDSRLGDYSGCNCTPCTGTPKTYKEEATMTSQLETVDAAVQTLSPLGSCCDLHRDMSTSNTGLHSLLGSPPGSRLNLKSPTGSHSNLVSASSSMFPVSSGEEEDKKTKKEDPEWDVASGSPNSLERRRSCLKLQPEEDRSRRGSMKQVQWDEEGLTWDIHGAALNPEELSTAIQKHLELKSCPRPLRPSSKKKKAPMPPHISNMATATDPDVSHEPAISVKCSVEGEREVTLAPGGKEAKQEAEGKTQETEETNRRTEQETTKDIEEEEVQQEEVQQEEVVGNVKSPTRGRKHGKKKTKSRSLMRPGWCGGSRKTDD